MYILREHLYPINPLSLIMTAGLINTFPHFQCALSSKAHHSSRHNLFLALNWVVMGRIRWGGDCELRERVVPEFCKSMCFLKRLYKSLWKGFYFLQWIVRHTAECLKSICGLTARLIPKHFKFMWTPKPQKWGGWNIGAVEIDWMK